MRLAHTAIVVLALVFAVAILAIFHDYLPEEFMLLGLILSMIGAVIATLSLKPALCD